MRILFFLSCIVGTLPALAQLSPGLHLARDVWNSRSTNPAIVQPYGVVVGLPGLHNDLNVAGIRYGEVIQERDDRLVIDAGRLLANLADRAQLRERASVPTLGLSFWAGETNISLSHTVFFEAALDIPRTFPELLWLGNAPFIGQTLTLDPSISLSTYQNLQLGVARELLDGLSVGISVNLVSGISALETERFRLDLTTDDDIYGLDLTGDLLFHSAGVLDYNGLDDIRFESPANRLSFDNFVDNPGVTVDVGMRYQRERWDLALSVLNVTDALLSFNENQATTYSGIRAFNYTGLDGNALLLGGESVDFNAALDTLTELLHLEQQAGIFTVALPRQFYLSALYTLNDDWTFGAALAGEEYAGESTVAAHLLARYRLLKGLTAGLTYGTHRGGFDQLGAQVYGQLGPVQLFALSEDVLGLLNLDKARRVHFRVGLNLLLGERE